MPPSDPRDFGYPRELRESETALLKKRHTQADPDGSEPWVGFGLSGGGIRSATFCLGVFQELAKLGLLGKVDYISSVSGGGYFASFLGRLFTREDVRGVEDVEKILSPDVTAQAEELTAQPGVGNSEAWKAQVFRWLRENSRYLSPKGAGDLLLDLAVMFRNWVAIQVVLITWMLGVFLVAQLLRLLLDRVFDTRSFLVQVPFGHHLWWSPYLLVAVAVFVFGVAPFGWSYWLIERPTPRRGHAFWRNFVWRGNGGYQVAPFIGTLAAIGVAVGLGLWLARNQGRVAAQWACASIALAGIETLVLWRWTWAGAWRRAREAYPDQGLETDTDSVYFALNDARGQVSGGLKWTLIIGLAVLAFAAIDSLGQTIYLLTTLHDARLKVWTAGIFGPLIAVAPFAKLIVANFGQTNNGKRVSVPWKWVATLGAVILALAVFTAIDVLSHGVAWDFKQPDPEAVLLVSLTPSKSSPTLPPKARRDRDECSGQSAIGHRNLCRSRPLLTAVAIAGLFSLLFGRTWTFLNRSSLQAMYAARLTSAYLGASNKRRFLGDGGVTEVVAGDDIAQQRYWQARDAMRYQRGAPIHLVNVTVNETLEARNQVQQQDRKGTGMALGPAGISLGVRHHVVFNRHGNGEVQYNGVQVFPENERFVVFDYGHSAAGPKEGRIFNGEPLSLGTWTAISGAAFSTGLGWRTSIGLSLLAGFFNVRLGYWWDSGVDPRTRRMAAGRRFQASGAAFNWLFPVQAYLFDEFLSRFHGTARRWWYLTDGGHFENLGGYELIRRRVRNIVLIDAEADPDYTFEGLANLVRKARLDFGAEIKFLTANDLDRLFEGNAVRKYFGTPEQLRRGNWIEEPVSDPNNPGVQRKTLKPVDLEQLSLAHAAVAEVFYYDEPDQAGSRLVYIKPTLTGDEPADVRRYHSEHPAFPQETTAEQWFNEAQWESYRKLGQHIAEAIFAGATKDQTVDRFWPY